MENNIERHVHGQSGDVGRHGDDRAHKTHAYRDPYRNTQKRDIGQEQNDRQHITSHESIAPYSLLMVFGIIPTLR